ncbi:putative cytochrome P450 E-class, group I [Triangularia setosa]|uniref:Cytochrome P450 E-class, group I n=1 Tax=Triangularia setosa TaxID=2587417 RepID=A0AAN6WEP0_9PEZI|nr:putative cytochrome P450 E-class, group I [Podospora setosa]
MTGLFALLGLSLPQLAGLISILIFTLLIRRRYFSPISDIPGPLAASFTRVWHILRILKGDQNLELIRLHDKHGHFVRIAPTEVSLSHPDAIKKVLASPYLHKAPWYKVIAFPDGRFQNPMSATDPAVKNELSRHLAPAYILTNLLYSEEAIGNTLDLLFDWLDKFSASKQPIHLDKFFTFATSDIIGEVIFSKQFGFLREGKDINNTIANTHPQAAYVSIAGFFRWFHVLFLSNRLITWLGVTPWGHLIDTAMSAIKERQENPNVEKFDALAHWLHMLEKSKGRMEMHEIHSAAFNAVAAGNETVATGLQAFVYYMIRHPTAWARCRSEVDAAKVEAVGGRAVSFADAQRLPFLQACIKEALRVFGPASMGLPRVVPKNGSLVLGDRTIPGGTTVSVNAWVIHHSKEIWGEDAREFNPDRWFTPDAARLEKYFVPWGFGYASCPGQNLAKIELGKICATLVKDYEFVQVDKAKEWKWKAYFTVVPEDWPCYVTRREAS